MKLFSNDVGFILYSHVLGTNRHFLIPDLFRAVRELLVNVEPLDPQVDR